MFTFVFGPAAHHANNSTKYLRFTISRGFVEMSMVDIVIDRMIECQSGRSLISAHRFDVWSSAHLLLSVNWII